MKIAFVFSIHRTTRSYSHAVASLASVVRDAAPMCEIRVFIDRHGNADSIAADIVQYSPSLLFGTSMSNQWNVIYETVRLVKRDLSDVLCVGGGTHLTARPQCQGAEVFDVVVIGPGENAIRHILDQPNQFLVRNTKQQSVMRGVLNKPLDEFPRPTLTVFPVDDVRVYPSVMFSRGCPYDCQYCMSRRGGIDGQILWKSPRRAVEEISDLISYANPDIVYIDDDTLLKNPKWVLKFCEIYQQEIDRPFVCNARPETIKGHLLDALKRAGCAKIGIGIESGSSRLRKLLGRPMPNSIIENAFALAHERGIGTWSFNMVGIPTETVDDLLETIALNERIGVDDVRVSVFTPYPGAPMGDHVDEAPQGYFRAASTLEPALGNVYRDWIVKLKGQNRLWLTESEIAILFENENAGA